MPGAGDQIQAMKGGILETADILVINKSDQPGARQLASELAGVIKMRGDDDRDWTPPIVLTSLNDPASIGALAAEIDRHQAWLSNRPGAAGRLERRRAQHVGSLVARRVSEVLDELPPEALREPLAALYETVVRRLAEPSLTTTRST
jgi:LAO/AO transport system kinase